MAHGQRWFKFLLMINNNVVRWTVLSYCKRMIQYYCQKNQTTQRQPKTNAKVSQASKRNEMKKTHIRVLSILKRNHIDTGCVSHFYAFFKHKNRFVYCLNFSHWVCLFRFPPSFFLSFSCICYFFLGVVLSFLWAKKCRFSLACE